MATNPTGEAFKESINIAALTSGALVSAALLNPLPLIAVAVAELAYLAIVPRSKAYQARLAARESAGVKARREIITREALPQMSPILQARWVQMENLRDSIASQGQSDPQWFGPIVAKLDALLELWLKFAAREGQFRSYLEQSHSELSRPTNATWQQFKAQVQAPPRNAEEHSAQMATQINAGYTREIESIDARMATESDASTQNLLRNRREVLARRREWAARSGKMQGAILHQLELMEDTFALINDQVRARAPEHVLADLQDVLMQSENTDQKLDEMSAWEQSASPHAPQFDSVNQNAGVAADSGSTSTRRSGEDAALRQ